MNEKAIDTAAKSTVKQSKRNEIPEDLAYQIVLAKLGIIGVAIVILIGGYKLSFLQALLAALVSSFGFIIPAWVAALGQKTGLPSLTLSRATFGLYGNRAAKAVAWVNAFGWTILQLSISCWLLTALITQGHITKNPWGVGTGGIIAVVVLGFLIWQGQSWNHDIRVWLHGLFVILSLVVAGIAFNQVNWRIESYVPSTNWLEKWLPAVMLAMVATSLISTMEAGNWGKQIKKGHYRNSTLVAALIGGGLPSYLLILAGLLLGYGVPDLSKQRLPFMAIYHLLPGWLSNSYYVVAVIILSLHAARSFKHATHLTDPILPHVRITKTQMQIGQLLLAASCMGVLVIVPLKFFEQFSTWLSSIGIIIFSWFGVFLADYLLTHRQGYDASEVSTTSKLHYHWEGILAWLWAVFVGALTTQTALWHGPWAHGIFLNAGNGVLLAGLVGFLTIFIFKIIPLKQ